MSDIDMILYNKNEKRFVPYMESKQWAYGIIIGPVDSSGHADVYQMVCGEKRELIPELDYISLLEFSGVDTNFVFFKPWNLCLSIKENKEDSGGLVTCGYSYDFGKRHLLERTYHYMCAEDLQSILRKALFNLDNDVSSMMKINTASKVPAWVQLVQKGYALYGFCRSDQFVKEIDLPKGIFRYRYDVTRIDYEQFRIIVRVRF